MEDISWSLVYKEAQFTIETNVLEKGGFREACMAKCLSKEFSDTGNKWVVKRYLPDAVKEIMEDVQMSIEQHTKKVVQMHGLAKNIPDQIERKVKRLNVDKEFGETSITTFNWKRKGDDFFTLEKFIEGKFEKYSNNSGEMHVSKEDPIGQKAEYLTHFSYEVSKSEIMVVDIQGSGHMLYDPEIASASLFDTEKEFLFCAGNLTKVASNIFVENYTCNKFCKLLGLKAFEKNNCASA